MFAKFFNGLVSKGKKTVVAYGAAKFAPGGKGEMAVPTSRAFKECSYRFLTVPVDEFMTTKMYNGDKQTVLKAVQRRDTGATVRGLLWCDSSTKDQSKFVNRDLNAALNIRDCFMARSRPAMLSRSADNNNMKRVQVVTGRIIN